MSHDIDPMIRSSRARRVAAVVSTVGLLTSTAACDSTARAGFKGGCAKYAVYAQNRWEPYGTAVRSDPSILATKTGSFPGNEVIAVNGWIEGSVAYPTNTPPWNSDVWFHLAGIKGWVDFAGVRGEPTGQDPTGLSPDGGTPALTPVGCEGIYAK